MASKTTRAVLLDTKGAVVRYCAVVRGTPYLLSLRDGRYYDRANNTTYVQRSDAKLDFLRVQCPTCHAWEGWACGRDHTCPIHRARIVAALQESPT